MDSGIPMSLLTPYGEIVFNDLTGDATSASLSGLDVPIWPGPGVVPASISAEINASGLPDGNGYLMQFVSGMHGSDVRNPVDNRPHKHGGIIHKFYSGPKYFGLDGLVVGDDPAIRQILYDYLAAFIFAGMQTDSRFFFKPPGQAVRFKTCRNYASTEVIGPAGSPGQSPNEVAGPKQFLAQFVSVNPFSYTYTERDQTITSPTPVFIPNDGTVETWPVLRVYSGAGPSPLEGFLLQNSTFSLSWEGSLNPGHYIEVDMYNETMYEDGNGANRLGGMTDDSDFWSIAAGGEDVSLFGGDHTIILSNDAWI